MPTMNILYDPEADAMHDRHAAEREHLAELLHGPGPRRVTGRARSKLQAAFDAHHLACLRTFKTRHATVQDYARWRFHFWTGGGEVPVVDFEALRSVEETDQLYCRLEAEARTASLSGLSIGQPPGLTAFSGGDLQFWRHFRRDELLTGSYDGPKGARALVTVSGRDGVWHICFMQDWTHVGVGVSEVFEDLANSVYHQALLQAGLRRAARGGVRGWLGRLVPHGLRGAALRPGSFRFYEHQPPRWRAAEEFSLVRMRFRHGRFGLPRREPYAVIPALLASVRRAAPRDAEIRIADVIPELPQAGITPPSGRLPPNMAQAGGQGSKGAARRFKRFLIEPALIVGAGLAGALIEFHYGIGHGDNPVIGVAAAAAGIATGVGMTRFFVREGYRRRWRMIGGFAVRFAFLLLCLCFELYGFSCWCDVNTADLPQMTPPHLITFE